MPENNSIPIALVTSNDGKAAQFRRYAPAGSNASSIPPLFREPGIKNEVEHRIPITNGYEYVAAISRGKFTEQRKKLQEQEGKEKDYAFLVSDAVAMVEKDGRQVAVNRDISETEKQPHIEVINFKGVLTFVGAVTFGRKNGESVMTTLSYIDIPLSGPIKKFPDAGNIAEMTKIRNPDKPYVVGYIKPNVRDGKLVYEKVPAAQTLAFDADEDGGEQINAKAFYLRSHSRRDRACRKHSPFRQKSCPNHARKCISTSIQHTIILCRFQRIRVQDPS